MNLKPIHYLAFVSMSIAIALVLGMYSRAGEAVEWLCNGRFIAEDGYVVYDRKLAIWLTVDGVLIFGAYMGIPALIRAVIKHREDVDGQIGNTLQKFVIFILMCGLGHLIDSVNIWLHWYYLAAGWHLGTALVSIDTLFSLKRDAGFFLSLPSRLQYDQYRGVSEKMQLRHKYGFWWLDFKTGRLEWTHGAKAIYNKPPQWEVDLAEIDAMVMPEYRDSYDRNTGEHRETGGEQTFTYGILVNGKPRIIEAGIFNIEDGNGGVTGIYGYIENLTDKDGATAEKLIIGTTGTPEMRYKSLSLALARIQSELTAIKLKKTHGR